MIIAEALGLPETEAKSRVNGDAQDYLEKKYPLAERDKIDLSSLGLQESWN